MILNKKWKKRIIPVAVFLLFMRLSFPALADLDIQFINIGQGDCALVLCDGEAMLIDGGPGSESSMVYTIVDNTVDQLKYLIAEYSARD